jgi:hypothetical protein
MVSTAILAGLVAAGVVVALQGLLSIRGRRQAHPNVVERPLIEALALKDERQVTLVLGRLRLVYGLFLIVLGVWGLAG